MEELARYQNIISGFPMGQVSTQVTPYFEPSRGQQFLGGAAALAGALGDNATTQERARYGLYGGILGMID
jgi:hypothetical protein